MPLNDEAPASVLVSSTDDPCSLLDDLGDELRNRGTTARELLAITFKLDGRRITVCTRRLPVPDRYPDLSHIFDLIGRTCSDQDITVVSSAASLSSRTE